MSTGNLQPGQTHYYKVIPENRSGFRQVMSPVASATTPQPVEETESSEVSR